MAYVSLERCLNAVTFIEIPVRGGDKINTSRADKIKQHFERSNRKISSRHDIDDILKAAAQRRQAILFSIRMQAASHLEYVRHVVSKHNEERIQGQAVLARNISHRQAIAADRKSRILKKVLDTITNELQSKLRRVSRGKSVKSNLENGLKEHIEQKMSAALLRRQFKLQADVIRLSELNQKKMSKVVMVKRDDMESRKYLLNVLQVKSASAFLRRKEELLKKYKSIKARNSLVHYKVEWNNRFKFNQRLAIAEAMERKLILAMENRVSFLTSKVLRCASISNFDRVMETQRGILCSAQRHLEDKLKNKMDANSFRRESFIRYQREKCLKAHANRELVLHKVIYMTDNLRTTVMEKVADQCRAANERRRLLLVNRIELLAAKRLRNSAKGTEARKYSEQKVFETYDRLISKQETASERKQEKIHSTIMKTRGTPSSESKKERNTDNLNVSYTKSLNTKTRDEIDVQLHDAAERREALLMMRAEQAGFMGSKRSASNFSPAFIQSCELSYSLSSPSSDTSMWVKPPPQCCSQWESPKQFEKNEVQAINCLNNLWMLDVIFQFFVHLSEKLQFVKR